MESWWVFILSMVLAGALRAWLQSKGWWFDWEKIDREKQEEKLVLRAYKEWRKNARPAEAADVSARLQRFTNRASNGRSIGNRTR